jgi:hypothetical protein
LWGQRFGAAAGLLPDVLGNRNCRLHHEALALEKTRNILALFGQPRDGIGGIASFLHTQ